MTRNVIIININKIFSVTCPILILHAQDDSIIPVELARKLYRSSKAANLNVTYVEFESKFDFQHKYIHRSKELPEIMR